MDPRWPESAHVSEVGALMVFRAWVRFPDGTVRHARYDSVTDTTTRFLCDDADEARELGWAMECDYDEAWNGQGVPVMLATDYDDTNWPGRGFAEENPAGPATWWITSGNAPADDVIADGLPEWTRG